MSNNLYSENTQLHARLCTSQWSHSGDEGPVHGLGSGQAPVDQSSASGVRYTIRPDVRQQVEQNKRYEVQRVDGETRVPVQHENNPAGVGGLPVDYDARKGIPLWTYMFEYFPDAYLAEVGVAVAGNAQHNLMDDTAQIRWAREKSTDQLNTAFRHLFDYGTGNKRDTDGQWHLAKAIWRLKAQLQLDIEAERNGKT